MTDTNAAVLIPVNGVDPVYEMTLWIATCSNKSRSTAECKKLTDTVFERLTVAAVSKERVAGWVAAQIATVFKNRGNDADFVEMMFNYDDPHVACGCVETLLDASQEGDEQHISHYLKAYTERYGETREILIVKLRWLSLFTNYPSNVEEVERILGILNAPSEAA